MFLGIKLEGWLTIIAIIVGPLLAFEVQRRRDNRHEKRNRKLDIFRRLLLTLKVPMAPSHVDAINSIPLDFPSDAGVLNAWRLYASHLNLPQRLGRPQTGEEATRWLERKFDLLVELVYEIGQNLGGFDHVDKAALRDNTYVPKGYSDVEEEWHQIRKAWLEVLNGMRPLPMTMLGPIQVEQPMPLVQELPLPAAPVPPALPPAEADA